MFNNLLNLNERNMSFDINSINNFNIPYPDIIGDNYRMDDLNLNNINNRNSGLIYDNIDSKTFETTFYQVFHHENDEEPEDFNYFCCDNNNNKKEKAKIFEIKKETKKGRLANNCTKKGKHNNKCIDNGTKAIINETTRASICPFLEDVAKEFTKTYNKRGYKFAPFKSNKFLIKGYNKMADFFDTSVKELSFNVENKAGLHNKRKINNLLEYEMNNDKIKVKKLNLLFNASYGGYLKSILNDSKYIKINGIEFYLGDNFKTLKDFYNTGDKVFTNDEKQMYKNNILEIMNRQKHTRKSRSKNE